MRRQFAGIFIAILTLSSAAPVSARQVSADKFFFDGVYFPTRVDSFTVFSANRWPDPSLGMAAQYGTSVEPNGLFNVFVYPIGDVDSSDPVELIERDFASTLDEVRMYQAQAEEGIEIAIDEELDHPLVVNGDTLLGKQAVMTLRRGSESRQSLVYVFVLGNSYVKFRMTYASSMRRVIAPRVEAFISGVVAGVEVDPSALRAAEVAVGADPR